TADMSSIAYMIGSCPQHDALWPDLDARTHLAFYGAIKGLSGTELHDAVEQMLINIQLVDFGSEASRTYSGGMKRRLSVGIALMGKARLVFMDEPTTGLDPQARRGLWNII
ncbi:ABC transporter A, ABCA, partial [Kipferlia bialata]